MRGGGKIQDPLYIYMYIGRESLNILAKDIYRSIRCSIHSQDNLVTIKTKQLLIISHPSVLPEIIKQVSFRPPYISFKEPTRTTKEPLGAILLKRLGKRQCATLSRHENNLLLRARQKRGFLWVGQRSPWD